MLAAPFHTYLIVEPLHIQNSGHCHCYNYFLSSVNPSDLFLILTSKSILLFLRAPEIHLRLTNDDISDCSNKIGSRGIHIREG